MKKLFAILLAIAMLIGTGHIASVSAIDADEYTDFEELIPRP